MAGTQPAKRKFPFSGLQRRVRARKDEPEPDLDEYGNQSSDDGSDDGASNVSDDDIRAAHRDVSEDEDEEDVMEEDDEDDEEPSNHSLAAAQISFGALAKAQASMPSARKKQQKRAGGGEGPGGDEDDKNDEHDGGEEDDEDDSAPEEFDRHGGRIKIKYQPAGRTNKHAPAEMTSKRQVTRRRQVVEVHKPQGRDPRFLPLGGPAGGGGRSAQQQQQQEDAQRHNYAFLDQYRDSEMAALRGTIKKTKDPRQKEKLQRALASMQGKKQARQQRDAERAVITEHRRREKELVKEGKTPFYLKKSEQKKQLLLDRFAGMKKGQVDKVIQRKRKAQAAKERMELPTERRAR